MHDHHEQDEEQFQPKVNLALWRKVFRFAWPYRGPMLGLALAAILTACCDVSLPLITGRLIDEVRLRGAEASLLRYGVLYAAAITVLAMCIWAFIFLAGRITTSVSYDIREASFAKLQELPFSFYDHKAVGWLMARLTSDCSLLSRILGWSMLDIVWGTCVLVVTSATMFVINWKLALIVLFIVPPMLLVSRFFQIRFLLASRLQRKANSQVTAAFNEGIVGVRTTKSLVREQQNLAEFSERAAAMYRHAVTNALYASFFTPVVLSLCSIGIGLALWQGGIDVLSGSITLGTLIMFIQYANNVSGPVQELASTFTLIQGAQASAERIQSLLDTDPQIKDSPEVLAAVENHRNSPAGPGLAADGLPDRIDSIEFRNVTFAYTPGRKVLENFNLTIHAGQSIALVGATGGGKTTIVGLLCRFYEPTSGQILINGIDYRARSLRWLQSNLGIVLQQPHLFSGSIRDNIRYGRLNATDAEIEHAAKLVNADEFIRAQQDGYDTQVGEGGNRLSTGQKQLIALARAVIARPRIFIMDEATSSVDTQTERAIQAAIDRLLTDRISFIIAHRLSTIRSVDRILVIRDGQIIEDGSHHDLIRLRGQYFSLYTNQFTEEKESEILSYSVRSEED